MRIVKHVIMTLILPMMMISCARFQETGFGHYSAAETAYNRGQYTKAIQKYDAYLAEYPEGNMAAISNYYIAKSHAALGNNDAARTGYQDVIDRYPKSAWADFSKTQLDELGSKA